MAKSTNVVAETTATEQQATLGFLAQLSTLALQLRIYRALLLSVIR